MVTSKRTSGFTLIELMVVVTIIIILAALTYPILRNAIENGRRATCRSNLRQIGAAFFMFATDHNGWLPVVNLVPGPPENTLEYLNRRTVVPGNALVGQWPFHQHILMLADLGYVQDPRKFWCPSDHVNGPALNVDVFPAPTFDPDEFNSFENVSYMYVAGYNLRSSREDFSRAPLLADESNQMEQGNLTPGNMPGFDEHDNHGANYRNVLWLDGHVVGLEHEDVGNVIFEHLQNTDILNSID